MFRVVRLCRALVKSPQVHRHDLQSLALDPGEDIADEPPPHAVGLDQDQGTFSHELLLFAVVRRADHTAITDGPAPAEILALAACRGRTMALAAADRWAAEIRELILTTLARQRGGSSSRIG